SATIRDGYRAAGQLTIFGSDAVGKAQRSAQAVLQQLRDAGITFRESLVECIGAGACLPKGVRLAMDSPMLETVMRIAVADSAREAVERFSRELMPLVTGGPPGTTGYAEGRPRVHPLFRYWPCLVERDRVRSQVEIISQGDSSKRPPRAPCKAQDTSA